MLVAPAPPLALWPYLLLGVVTHNGFKVFLLLAYRTGDLSRVYPLARGSAPLLVALFSGVVAGEALTWMDLASVLLISLGLMSLALERGLTVRGLAASDDRRGLWYALASGTCIAAYTLIDGMGVRLSGTVWGYSAWLFFVDAIPFMLIALVWRGRYLRQFLRGRVAPGVLAGSLSGLAYFIVMWALNHGAMAPVAALRETGVVFAALIGTVVLGESFGVRRILAAALVATGVVVMNLG
jgi:drug/metabolite transporter (DMT)-like permease